MSEWLTTDWHAAAQALDPPGEAFIEGKLCAAQDGQTFAAVNPATGDTITHVARCKAADVDAAVVSARRAFNAGNWSRATPSERKAVLLRLAALLQEHKKELALLDTLCMGAPIADTYGFGVDAAADTLAWYGEAADKLYGEVAPTGASVLATITREPVGVVGAVVPWNFPLDIAIWKVAPALMAGNSVVLKPAEQSPLSAIRLGQLACAAGLPAGVLNIVPGFGAEAGEPLGRHMDVDCIAFTGSGEIGGQFLRYAGESNLKMVWLECGGKSPHIVFADCKDLDRAAAYAAQGIFSNQGEICSASSRLLVAAAIHDAFLERLAAHAADYQPGDPLDPATRMGAIVEARQTQRIMDYIDIGRKEGARLVTGGVSVQQGKSDNFVQPTVFADVNNGMRIAQEEIFGPVLSVIPFDDEAEAIAIANDTLYGLAAAVWTDDLRRAHRVADALHAGTVSVNTVDAISPFTPFGGFKQSGFGRDLSLHAIDKFTQLKTTWIDLAE